MLHPDHALQLTRDHQQQLRDEAARERLVAMARGTADGVPLKTRLLVSVSDLLLAGGLWLRARSGAPSPVAATPRGVWQPLPLLLLWLAHGQASTASMFWWPVYGLGAPSLVQRTGYAVVPVAWLAPAHDAPRQLW